LSFTEKSLTKKVVRALIRPLVTSQHFVLKAA